jgi:hypothetical protein
VVVRVLAESCRGPRVKVFNTVAAAQIEVHHEMHSDLHQSVLLINVRSRFFACLDLVVCLIVYSLLRHDNISKAAAIKKRQLVSDQRQQL